MASPSIAAQPATAGRTIDGLAMRPTDDANRSASTAASTAGSAAIAVPIIEVAFRDNMWCAMPPELSARLCAQALAGEGVSYTWGERSYTLDFEAMVQTNTANGRRRTIRIVHVGPDETTPLWTGEIPQH